MLKGKTVLLGVTGGIAAYKAAALASALVKQHAAVEVVMTKNATEFVTPLTFEQIAYTSGYTNEIHFYRQFKKKTGMTPGEYRISMGSLSQI